MFILFECFFCFPFLSTYKMNLKKNPLFFSRRFGLVPLAAEDYGDMSMKFKVVAVARKTDKSTTLFNMKGLICTSSPIDDLYQQPN